MKKAKVRRWKSEDGRLESGKFQQNKRVSFKFEKIIIWQKAMDYAEDIFKLSSSFPKDEMYNLTSQIRRATDSIALNISEGSIGQSDPEFKRFMGMAIRSLAEVVTCLHKAKRRNYLSEQEFNIHYDPAYNLMNMMIAFKKKINSIEKNK
jgi:four helix bundle protein